MLSLQVSKVRILAVLLLAVAAVAAFVPRLCAAERMSLWNGDIKKGDITVRRNDGMCEAAVDEMIAALGLSAKRDASSIIAVLDGVKIEFWSGANIVRSAGSIISLPMLVSSEGGHWWCEHKAAAEAFGVFYGAIGKSPEFSWGEPSSAPRPATAKPSPPLVIGPKQEDTAPAVQQPAAPEIKEPEAEPTPEPAPAAPVAAPSFVGREKPVVVVDAGHGGHDPGAQANGAREKDINLKAAMQLVEILRGMGVDARPTRTTDVYLKLAERTAFANENDADVFVSLHCNAMPKGNSGVAGLEYYIMAPPSDKDALNLAIAENKEISGNVESAADVQQADRKTQLLLKILGDMQQNDKISESTTLAEVMHRAAKAAAMPMRKVSQAPFFVLRGAAMPAVLVEMGYVTNAAEAGRLNSASYRDKLCRVIAQGVVQYIKEHPTQR